jgi:AAA+ ATPase superfamily predicted ATPase
MFIGRKSELENLNKYYAKNDFQFLVIRGRRRVGKTTFINQFCAELFTQFNSKYYLLFSKSNFDKKITEKSEKDGHIMLVQLDNLFYGKISEKYFILP